MNCPEALDAGLALVRNITARLVRGRAAVLRQLNRAYSGLHIGANEATVLVAIEEGVSTTRRASRVAIDPDTRSYEGIESTYDAVDSVDITRLTPTLETVMATDTVKLFNDAKGFGFITPDDGGEDMFAHFSEVKAKGFKSPQEGEKVSFEVKQGPKGKQAANIQPL
jgi:CspA family cold shock protein